MKTNFLRAFILSIAVASFFTGCEKVNSIPIPVSITINDVSSLTDSSAIFSGLISGGEESKILERGFCWIKSVNPKLAESWVYNGSGLGQFSSNVTGLDDNTTYYVRAFGLNGIDTIYSNEQSFITKIRVPIVCFDYSDKNGYKVSFTNCSKYGSSYLWDFGDGTTSTEKEPIHEYKSLGLYNVKLTVTNEGVSDFVLKSIAVSDEISLAGLRFEMNPKEYYRDGAYLDVDGDGVNDFWISIYDHFGTTSESYSSIGPRNNYELFVDSALVIREDCGDIRNHKFDTTKVEIPKIFVFGNEISNSGLKSMSNHYIARLTIFSRVYEYNRFWIKDEIRYIGFRKIVNSKTMLGWIKLKVTGYNVIKLISYKIPKEAESLIIDR